MVIFFALSKLEYFGLILEVRVGTSSGMNKLALRSLLGWIELFNIEVEGLSPQEAAA